MSKISDDPLCAAKRILDGSTSNYAKYESVRDCNSPKECALYLLRKNYLRKLCKDDKRLEKARHQATLEKWLDAEKHCYSTNKRLGDLSDFSETARFLRAVGERIRSVIGESPPTSLVTQGRWSGGATAATPRGTHLSVKQGTTMAVTSAAARHVPFFFQGLRRLKNRLPAPFTGSRPDFAVLDENRGVMVPKSVDINRMIACEPAANAFMQQAVHAFLRRRISRHGVANLDDQRPNQDGAFRALVDGLATLDLSNASDTVSIELVRWVLPPEWFSFLSDLRSPRMRIDGRTFYLEKFSSMGNAFTFELETLIFWAIAKTVDPAFDPIVYGDDIIVRQVSCHNVIVALKICGFLINTEKSYTDGPFFESCGKYYYELEDVTPAFQKEVVRDVWSAFRAYNRLIRWGQRTGELALALRIARPFWTAYPDFQDCLVPYGCELDSGFLAPHGAIRRTKSGDFICNVLKAKATYQWNSIDSIALSYKLYAPSHSCEHPKGWSCTSDSRQTEFRARCVVWYANCV